MLLLETRDQNRAQLLFGVLKLISRGTAQKLLEKEVARQVALLSIKLQLISGAKPQDLVLG